MLQQIQRFVFVFFLMIAPLAYADQISLGVWDSAPGKFSLIYHLVHKFHKVEGKSVEAEARAVVSPTDIKVMARAPIKSFDSKNASRDVHAMEILEAQKYPMVIYKGIGKPCEINSEKCELELTGNLEFHGTSNPCPAKVELFFDQTGRMIGTFQLEISLEAYQIERPSLMFVPVDDQIRIEGNFEMEHQS